MTLAIGHVEEGMSIVDCVREVPAPFSPMAVVEEFAGLLRDYRIRTVFGDRYAGEWPPEQFQRCGISYEPSELNKSEIYLAFLPMLNSRTVALLTNDRLQRQLLSLERSASRAGRDIIDHPRHGKDDVANAVAGCMVTLQHAPGAARVPGFNRQISMEQHGWGRVA
jgi:hypothetical protein